MDSLRLGYEEHFDTFESFMSLSEDDSQSAEDALANYKEKNDWDWEREEEINGDVAVIPTSSFRESTIESNSPPVKEDFQKIMNDWQQLINFENEEIKNLSVDIDMVSNDQFSLSEPFSLKSSGSSLFDLPDLTENSTEKPQRIQHGGKKLDLTSQCYMVDKIKEEVDSESENIDVEGDFQVDINSIIDVKPAVQTQDIGSLLELFETEIDQVLSEANIKQEDVHPSTSQTNSKVFKTQNELPVSLNTVKRIKKEPGIERTPTEKDHNGEHSQNKEHIPTTASVDTHAKPFKEVKKNSYKLPKELINKIKASNKRRSIAILDVLPNSKRVKTKKIEEQPTVQREKKNTEKSVNKKHANVSIEEKNNDGIVTEWIHLDHDYCGSKSPHSKIQKKDSGFESAEEEEQRNILKNQPTVKRADGKLMVSLLKVNTIKHITANLTEAQTKRKLNLEEYKKRREGLLKSYENSQNSSPLSSGQCSPAIEDENVRRLKHQEKLLQMAAELLKSSPKSKKLENGHLSTIPDINTKIPKGAIPHIQTENCDKIKSQNREKVKDSDTIKTVQTEEKPNNEEKLKQSMPDVVIPQDFIAKTIVSIGVNTDFIKIPLRKNKQINLSPIKQLEEIKPILQNANGKINSNSLIASVIENIQNKVKTETLVSEEQTPNTKIAHGEDRTIVYLPKNRNVVKTCSIAIQTDFSEDWSDSKTENSPKSSGEKDSKHRERQRDEREKKHDQSIDRSSRSSSLDSRYSNASTSSSRSRSISPQRIPVRKRPKSNSKEHLRAVEERRIVYVGGISLRTSREDLRRRFQKFGPITNVSIHFRDYGDNYGFVTFMYNVDAYEAVEHGNDDPTLPQYDLSFGGRRIFCRTQYSDLDDIREEIGYAPVRKSEESFDNLLREMQAKLCKRNTT